jgi:dTDP-4-amino-4,6-dideoxygalactose transaminase
MYKYLFHFVEFDLKYNKQLYLLHLQSIHLRLETYLLDINEVRKLLEADEEKRIKGIIPVDFAGRVVDMEAFRAMADEFGCWLIEDACHAPGGSLINVAGNKIKAGSGLYADLAIFSFHPVKHIAAGEGGMITTNDKELYERLLILRTHGIQQDLSKRIYDDSSWYYEMQELGYNYRMTDIQAALGNSQLQRADIGLLRRREIAHVYKEAFKNNSSIVDRNEGYSENHAYHLYVIEVKNRKALHSKLKEENIYAQIHYIPAHLMPYYRQFGWKKGDLPNAEDYYDNCISVPMYATLSDLDQNFVIKNILQR